MTEKEKEAVYNAGYVAAINDIKKFAQSIKAGKMSKSIKTAYHTAYDASHKAERRIRDKKNRDKRKAAKEIQKENL